MKLERATVRAEKTKPTEIYTKDILAQKQKQNMRAISHAVVRSSKAVAK